MTKRRSSWRRWVVRGAVCVVLGVLTTVGVAWGLAAAKFVDAQYFLGGQSVHDGRLDLEICAGVGRVRRCSFFVEPNTFVRRILSLVGFGGRSVSSLDKLHHATETWSRQLDHRPSKERTREATGWPRLAVWCGYCARGPSFVVTVHGGIALAEATGPQFLLPQGRALPCRPIWSGLIIDSAVYACLWGAVWFVCLLPGRVRRSRRLRRGLCVGCGYELAGLMKCPECGK